MTTRPTDPAAPGFRSEIIRRGTIRATTRSFLHALGQDDEDIARPHIGVFHTGGEMSPCNLNLRDQAQHAKTGIYAGGGTPHECPVVSVSDGLTMAHSGMRFSLISVREMAQGQRLDLSYQLKMQRADSQSRIMSELARVSSLRDMHLFVQDRAHEV